MFLIDSIIIRFVNINAVIFNSNNFCFVESDNYAGEDLKINKYDDRIKPHEQRVLNFLVNEYLMQHNYKLTSITFADENENQVNYNILSYMHDIFFNLYYNISLYFRISKFGTMLVLIYQDPHICYHCIEIEQNFIYNLMYLLKVIKLNVHILLLKYNLLICIVIFHKIY